MKQRIYFSGFICLIMFMITACEQHKINKLEKNESLQVYSFEHPENNQRFNIVHAYKLFHVFDIKEKSNSNSNQFQVYKQKVIEPIYNDCFRGGEYLNQYEIETLLFNEPDFERIKSIYESIDSDKINLLIKEALIESSKILPQDNETTVCIFPSADLSLAPMVTAGSGKIIVLFNELFDEEYLKAGISHEYHHSYWTNRYFNEDELFTVLDDIVFEGKAIMFEKLIYPDSNFTTINYSFNKEYWSKVEPRLNTYDPNKSSEILYGGNEFPRNYGYSEGYKILKSFLDLNPHITVEEWTGMNAKQIFEMGHYIDLYK